MKNLQPTVTTYTIAERATRLYNGVVEGFITDKTSDVVTPFELALKQVRELPIRSGNVLVPGAGIGTYILALLQEGFKPEQITAVEFDPAYSRLGKGIFSRFGINYVTADFTYWQPNMQFDVVIGNPPYQAPKNANGAKSPQPLWRKFLAKASDLVVDGGYVALIVPSSVAKFHCEGKVSPALQKVPQLAVQSVQTGLESHFGVGTEISLISFVKGAQGSTIKLNGKLWDWQSRPWVPRISEEKSVILLQKLLENEGRLEFVPQYHWKPLSIDTNTSVGTWGMNRGKDYGIQSLEGYEQIERKAHLMCCEFATEADRDAAVLLFKSPVYRFLKAMLMFGSDVAFGTLSSLPVPEGWQHIKSSDEVVELFGLTQEETELVLSY